MAKSYLTRSPVSGNRASSGVDDTTRKRVSDLFAEAKGTLAPGGGFMKGVEAQVGRGRKRAVASGMQGLAAAGLASTSMMGGIGKKYEEEVAQPALAVATTARLSALSGLLREEAGMTASLATRYSTTPQGSSGGYSRPFASKPSAPSTPRDSGPRERSATYGLSRNERAGKKRFPTTATRPTLNLGKSLPDPVGTWQATIGSTSFHTGPGGSVTRKEVPLSSYYKNL